MCVGCVRPVCNVHGAAIGLAPQQAASSEPSHGDSAAVMNVNTRFAINLNLARPEGSARSGSYIGSPASLEGRPSSLHATAVVSGATAATAAVGAAAAVGTARVGSGESATSLERGAGAALGTSPDSTASLGTGLVVSRNRKAPLLSL